MRHYPFLSQKKVLKDSARFSALHSEFLSSKSQTEINITALELTVYTATYDRFKEGHANDEDMRNALDKLIKAIQLLYYLNYSTTEGFSKHLRQYAPVEQPKKDRRHNDGTHFSCTIL